MKRDYFAIPGLGSGGGSFRVAMRHRLYQGPDHLLLIQSTGFTDDYRRLYYRDIGCVVVRETQRRNILSVVLIALMGLIFLLRLANAPWVVVLVPCVPLLILFVINLLRGPTCACYITTRVQTVEVPTPQRVSKVPRLIDFLRAKMIDVADAPPLTVTTSPPVS
jgi:hypothetical protein